MLDERQDSSATQQHQEQDSSSETMLLPPLTRCVSRHDSGAPLGNDRCTWLESCQSTHKSLPISGRWRNGSKWGCIALQLQYFAPDVHGQQLTHDCSYWIHDGAVQD